MTRQKEQNTTLGRILDQVDDTLDAAASIHLCACGCRRRVPPDGPSFDFASASCQHRWHDRNVDRPEEIAARPDAAHFGAHEFLTTRSVPPETAPPAEPAEMLLEPDTVPGAAYRRYCANCDEHTAPRIWIDEYGTAVRHFCSHCLQPMPSPVYRPTVHYENGRLVLELSGSAGRVRRYLHLYQLDRFPGRDELILQTWHAMERQLARFGRSWTGRFNPLAAVLERRSRH